MAQRLRQRRGLSPVEGERSDGEGRSAGSHELLAAAAERIGAPPEGTPARPRVGVDLGTASCVLVVLDSSHEADRPLWVESAGSGALQDGVVVDFARVVATVRELRERAGEGLGTELTRAATAYPPCIPVADARACAYVCEAAGFHEVTLVDEVTAAQRTLEITDGVVVDVGGGSTGVGVFRDGRLERLDDRPGGGHHLDLVLAGALGVDVAEAERFKRERPAEALPILVPGVHRIAESIRAMTRGTDGDLPLHLAGGALMIPRAGDVLAQYLQRTVVTHPHALLITPLGIARSAP